MPEHLGVHLDWRQMSGAMLVRARGASKACLWARPRVCVPACILASTLSKCKNGCMRPHLQVPSPSLLGCRDPASLFGSLKGAPSPGEAHA